VSDAAVEVRGLVMAFGQVAAVRGIGFKVRPGETSGFLAPNGAGKPTTIKILCTLASPTAGEAKVARSDVVRQSRNQTEPNRRSGSHRGSSEPALNKRATQGGYGGKPPCVAIIGVPTGARNAGKGAPTGDQSTDMSITHVIRPWMQVPH
jgi:energy-coupling factor transporter ATP-binding protein EcfA2